MIKQPKDHTRLSSQKNQTINLPFSIVFFLLTLLPRPAAAQVHYTLTSEAVSAYESILALEMDAATATLKSLKKEDPNNLAVYHLENYIDFFYLYLTEDEAVFNERLDNKDDRIEQLEKLPASSPWRNYAIAEVRLHWALIRLRFESYLPAFRDVNKAHKLLRDNAKKFPDFLPTYKDLGLLHAAVGSIPPQFKWGVELMSSLQGSIREGQREMTKALADKSSPFYRETAVLSALVQLHLANDSEAAWREVRRLNLKPTSNKLHCFVVANVAMRSGRNDLAIELLEAQPRGGSSMDFAYLDFMLGLAKLRKLDYGSRLYFQSFLFRFNGQHFVKEAVQKIAWAELLRGREDLYRKRISEVTTKGNATAGGDLNASNEAAATTLPHQELLRARLLFDGSYYTRARHLMSQIDPKKLANNELKLEYYYRTGRILHGLKSYPAALSFYERTIAQGKDENAFFACNAALQAGLIQELLKNEQQAKRYYELCLSMSPDEYRLGLHIQAKAGLNRL